MKLTQWMAMFFLGIISTAHGASNWDGDWFGTDAELVFWYENSPEPFLFEGCKLGLPIEKTDTELRTGTLRIDCARSDGMEFEHTVAGAVFKISQDGSLYDETKRVGRVTDSRLELQVADQYAGIHYLAFTLEKTPAGQDGIGLEWYFRPELASPFDVKTRAPLLRNE